MLHITASRGFSELAKNVIRSSHGHSTPSLKISCKSVQPFSRNLANKETKKEREIQRHIQRNQSKTIPRPGPPIYREWGNKQLFCSWYIISYWPQVLLRLSHRPASQHRRVSWYQHAVPLTSVSVASSWNSPRCPSQPTQMPRESPTLQMGSLLATARWKTTPHYPAHISFKTTPHYPAQVHTFNLKHVILLNHSK